MNAQTRAGRSPLAVLLLAAGKGTRLGLGKDAPAKVMLECLGEFDESQMPASERAQVEVDMPVSVWIDGQEGTTIVGRVARIYPRSELRNSKNVFIAECEFENNGSSLRPGMEGHARIDCRKRPLGWCLFHKPWGFIKSRLTFW